MSDDLSELKGDVRVLASQVAQGQKETTRRLDTIERKIDNQVSVSVGAFEEYKKEAKEAFASKEGQRTQNRRIALLERIVFTAIGVIAVSVLGAVLKWVLR